MLLRVLFRYAISLEATKNQADTNQVCLDRNLLTRIHISRLTHQRTPPILLPVEIGTDTRYRLFQLVLCLPSSSSFQKAKTLRVAQEGKMLLVKLSCE